MELDVTFLRDASFRPLYEIMKSDILAQSKVSRTDI